MEPWEERWRLADPADQGRAGGQGIVRKVFSRDGRTNGGLKCLHSAALAQTERRFRFQQEANSLLALEGDLGTPKLLDTNSDQWNRKGTPLYLVLEWVPGPTLTQAGRQSLTDALAAFEALLRTLQRCETLGVRHRDIKPDNIILRDGNRSTPVLIDFGLSWLPAEGKDEFQTPAGQELGNRFLRLPEFAPGHDHRDHRSDLTLAVGLLYYMLTGRAPRVLEDAGGRLPHENCPMPDEVSRDQRWPMVRRIFQVGFQPILDRRFERAEQVLSFIERSYAEGPEVSENELNRELEAFRAILESDAGRARDQTAEILLSGSRRFLETVQQSVAPASLLCGGSGPNIIDRGLVAVGCNLQFFAVRSGTSSPQAHFSHSATVEHGRLTATAMVEGRNAENYYEGPIADREGFEQAARTKGREIATFVIRSMRNMLTAQ